MNFQLIETALQNGKVKELFDSVNAVLPLEFEPSQDTAWSITIINNKAKIEFTPTENPAAALAHELLHAKLLIDGYTPYLTTVSMDGRDHTLIAVLEELNNHLQHHKFFSLFEDLGLSAIHFYGDCDVDSYARTSQWLDRLPPSRHTGHLLVLFLTVIGPGGAGDENERIALRNQFERHCSVREWEMLKTIEAEIENWKKSSTLNAGPTIIRILKCLNIFDRTWVGTAQDFPHAGLFVDQRFG